MISTSPKSSKRIPKNFNLGGVLSFKIIFLHQLFAFDASYSKISWVLL